MPANDVNSKFELQGYIYQNMGAQRHSGGHAGLFFTTYRNYQQSPKTRFTDSR